MDSEAIVDTKAIQDADGFFSVLQPEDALAPHTNYRAYIETQVNELLPGGGQTLLKVDGEPVKQVREVVFTSGDRPDHIAAENVMGTYPIVRQRHFLQDEGKDPQLGSLAGKG